MNDAPQVQQPLLDSATPAVHVQKLRVSMQLYRPVIFQL
jgi:hypothetical protein